MRYDLFNPTRAPRIIYDGLSQREIRIAPGCEALGVPLSDVVARNLFRTNGQDDLIIEAHDPNRARRDGPQRPSIVLDGHYGIGDAIHQRGVVRELMAEHDVWLTTCHFRIFEDLVKRGLKLLFKPCRLHAQAKTIEREREFFPLPVAPPAQAPRFTLTYNRDTIAKHGSIIEAMAACVGVKARPLDFSLPVPDAWMEAFKARFSWDTGGKPIMVYRPIVLRREWNGANRNPDPGAYSALFRAVRDKFFVVSVADLEDGVEWIVGQEEDADVKLHKGELTFEDMAALWREAAIGFFNAGFAPVLAQAVGTPSIVVYGGRESFRTTQRAGAHLAPTLGVDPDQTCDCQNERHDCGSKHITLEPAIGRVKDFAEQAPQTDRRKSQGVGDPQANEDRATDKILIFATTYVDSDARERLTRQWLDLHTALNPDCEFLIVDSASPLPVLDPEWAASFKANPQKYRFFNFGDNVGHLSRHGRDGWGRAFCRGLDYAVERGYDYVLHIEGDSLLRVPAREIVAKLKASGKGVASIPVRGTTREFPNWVETGLMCFKTSLVREMAFSACYDWQHRESRPTPELVVHHLIGGVLLMLDLKGLRGDKNQIAAKDIPALDLDWVTHCHNDIWVYDRFVEANLPKGGEAHPRLADASAANNAPPQPRLKLNLGCGTNRLDGWKNHDADVDITKPLPWADGSASFIFIEHCVEHVSYHEAIRFFEEARRVLGPDGVLRVTVPSVERIRRLGTRQYFDFTRKFGGDGTLRGALTTIIFKHGHLMGWTASVMREALLYAGFAEAEERAVGESRFPELRGVEGHGKVIGDAFNRIESMVFEARKAATNRERPGNTLRRGDLAISIAAIVGGSPSVWAEIGWTAALAKDAGRAVRYFVINDMIPLFPGPCTAVTLHPAKLNNDGWLAQRERNGWPAPEAVWAHVGHEGVTDFTDDWRGSSGLFALKVAFELGCDKAILCGVPMEAAAGHILRAEPWTAAEQFMTGWKFHLAEIKDKARSWGGWTGATLGKPDLAFLA